MPRVPIILERANLFVGGESDADSLHLVLTELKLPNVEESYEDHQAGGARYTIEVDMFVGKLVAGFMLAGWQPDILQVINRERLENFTAYGLLRDKQTGEAQELKAIMRGRLGKADPQPFAVSALHHVEFVIRAIVYYELTIRRPFGGKFSEGTEREIYKFDWFADRRRFSNEMNARYASGRAQFVNEMNWLLGV